MLEVFIPLILLLLLASLSLEKVAIPGASLTYRKPGMMVSLSLTLVYPLFLWLHPKDHWQESLEKSAIMAAFLFFPACLQYFQTPQSRRLWLDVATVAAIWLPIEFRWVPSIRLLSVEITSLLALVNVLVIFLLIAPWQLTSEHPRALGHTFRWKPKDLAYAFGVLPLIIVAIVPIGLAVKFLEVGLLPFDAKIWAAIWLGNYFLIALPEELLFRGVIQNLVERQLSQMPQVALGISAFIFGIAHVNNHTAGHPVPNWAYVLLATIAGVFYGLVWRHTGKITVSALTHATTNAVWLILFSGGK